jgi:hypothetical protein
MELVKNLAEFLEQPAVTLHIALKSISSCLLGKRTAVDIPVIRDSI